MYKMASIYKRVATMMKSSLIRINLIFVLLVLFIPNLTSAELKTFIKEYTYQASDFDSRNSSRTISLELVKRLLLEELGTYLVSETEVKDMRLTNDQVTAYVAGIVSAEIVDERWDGKSYWLKAKVSADPKEVEKALKKLVEDKSKMKELEETRKKAEELTKENGRLRRKLEAGAKSKQRDTKVEAKNVEAYEKTIRGLNAVDWFEKGYEAGTAGRYNEAIEAFTKAIELKLEGVWGAYNNRGSAYVDLGRYKEALKDFNKTIELMPDYAAGYMNRGIVYGKLGDRQKKIKDLDMVIKLKPDYVEAYHERGLEYSMSGNSQKAIRDYSRAIELGSENARTYINRSAEYLKLDKGSEALQDATKAIELNPDNIYGYINQGNAYANLENYQKAIESYDKAIKIDSVSAEAYFNRGLTYGKMFYKYGDVPSDRQAIKDLILSARLGFKPAQDLLHKIGEKW
jgi:tetratricopeptide (TPR) repeat protein